MPVSVIIGGQYGSEGKGKVALDTARRLSAAAVVRVGGTNSGHTGVADNGNLVALRQLPASALAPDVMVLLPAGSLIDIDIFQAEVSKLHLDAHRVRIDPKVTVITQADKLAERSEGLVDAIGSTGSGSGAALRRRISRASDSYGVQALDHPQLSEYIEETSPMLRRLLSSNERVVIEGTQGFGLSLYHGGYYPKATSRDTTAGTFVGEAGLSPLDVDDVKMVIRTFPIRVAGDSGELPNETTWKAVAAEANLPSEFHELTTATKKVRRVGRFHPEIVRRAIEANAPSEIVLNHVDYIDPNVRHGHFSDRVKQLVLDVEDGIGRSVNWIGTSAADLQPRGALFQQAAA